MNLCSDYVKNIEKLSLKKGRICNFEDCKTGASYGKPGSKIREYCAKHKLDNMINIKHKTCKTLLCNKVIGKKRKEVQSLKNILNKK